MITAANGESLRLCVNAPAASLRDSGGVEVWSVWLPRGVGRQPGATAERSLNPQSRIFLDGRDGLPIPEALRGQRQTIPADGEKWLSANGATAGLGHLLDLPLLLDP